MKNFIDFLSVLSEADGVYKLVVPCAKCDQASIEDKTRLEIKQPYIKFSYYEGHIWALFKSFVNAIKLRRLIKDEAAKNICVAGPGPNSFMFWASLLLPSRVKYVYFIRGDTAKTVAEIYKGKAMYPFAISLVRLFQTRINYLQSRCRAYVFVYGEELAKLYSVSSNVKVIMPLIEDKIISPVKKNDIAQDGVLKILYLGRLSEEKNILNLIEAVRNCLQKGAKVELTIAGHGDLESAIIKKLEGDSVLGDKARFVGYIKHGDELCDLLDKNHLLCLPSKTEGVPRVVIEAFARGLAVLATPVGSLPVLFPESIRYLSGFEVAQIEDGIHWCSKNTAKLEEMTEIGRANLSRFLIRDNAEMVNAQIHKFAKIDA